MVVKVALSRLFEVLDLFLEEEGVSRGHHHATVVLIKAIGQWAFVAFHFAWLVRIFTVFILEIFILVLVAEAALPLGTIFFLLVLEDLNLNAGQYGGNLASLSANDLLEGDAIINLVEELNVLLNVNMSAPSVGNAEQGLLELGKIHGGFGARVEVPFLGDLACHLILAVERQQYLVDALHQSHILILRNLVGGTICIWLCAQQLPELGANSLKVGVQENAALVRLCHHGVDLEGCQSKQTGYHSCLELLGGQLTIRWGFSVVVHLCLIAFHVAFRFQERLKSLKLI